MKRLHIVQAGIDNGDKKWLKNAAKRGHSAPSWVTPKNVAIGDDVVVYISGFGFFATARITSTAKPRNDWTNRYGAGLGSIKLITPAISLFTIQTRIPDLTWANYPRSITTPDEEVAKQIRKLIESRREKGIIELNDEELASANLDELKYAALLGSKTSVPKRLVTTIYRIRSKAIHLYVLRLAEGTCEGCGEKAPFLKPDGTGYLEPHHTTRLADEGPDHPSKVIALCPNCHRKAHHAENANAFNKRLIRKLKKLRPN